MLWSEPGAFPAPHETLGYPYLCKVGLAKAPSAPKGFEAMLFQRPIGGYLAGVQRTQRQLRFGGTEPPVHGLISIS
jgi:hypothetical protein